MPDFLFQSTVNKSFYGQGFRRYLSPHAKRVLHNAAIPPNLPYSQKINHIDNNYYEIIQDLYRFQNIITQRAA